MVKADYRDVRDRVISSFTEELRGDNYDAKQEGQVI